MGKWPEARSRPGPPILACMTLSEREWKRTSEIPSQECQGPRSQPRLGRQQGQGDGCRTWGDPQTKKIRNPGSLLFAGDPCRTKCGGTDG